jgi:hypothetical protein
MASKEPCTQSLNNVYKQELRHKTKGRALFQIEGGSLSLGLEATRLDDKVLRISGMWLTICPPKWVRQELVARW